MYTTEDILKHAGVKGMKWGVRKDRKSGSKKPGAVTRGLKKARDYLDEVNRSNQREIDWKKLDTSKMTTKQMKASADRLRLENDYKRLAPSKKEYRNRAKMSNQELFRKVNRLRVQEALNKEIKLANKDRDEAKAQIEAWIKQEGKKMVLKSVLG